MKKYSEVTVGILEELVRKFVQERDWEKYHNPKNIAEAICVEAAELLEIFQWISAEQTTSWKSIPSKLKQIRKEVADIVIYCLIMANTMDIDIAEAVKDKIKQNEKKYPMEKYYGKASRS